MTLREGDRLGPSEVLARLGEGGMGEVFRARDARLGRADLIQGFLFARPMPADDVWTWLTTGLPAAPLP